MTTHEFTLRVRTDSEQPETFVLAAVAAAGRGILEGWCENTKIEVVASKSLSQS